MCLLPSPPSVYGAPSVKRWPHRLHIGPKSLSTGITSLPEQAGDEHRLPRWPVGCLHLMHFTGNLWKLNFRLMTKRWAQFGSEHNTSKLAVRAAWPWADGALGSIQPAIVQAINKSAIPPAAKHPKRNAVEAQTCPGSARTVSHHSRARGLTPGSHARTPSISSCSLLGLDTGTGSPPAPDTVALEPHQRTFPGPLDHLDSRTQAPL